MVPRDASLTQQVLSGFAKHGPWALLVILILGYFGYQLNRVVPLVSEYVIQSAKNNERLVDSVEEMQTWLIEAREERVDMLAALTEGAKYHTELTQTLTTLVDEENKIRDQVLKNGMTMEEIQKLMQAAQQMMKDVPQQRQEQIDLLKKIEIGIEELRKTIIAQSALGEG